MFKVGFLVFSLLFSTLGCFAQQNNPEENILPGKTENQDPNAWDFGLAKGGQILKHDFTLKNESTKPLNIKQVSTSCGCTASEVKKKNLLPGESTVIEVSFDTKGYSGLTLQYIYVLTDSLDNPIIRYIIKAYVVK